MACHLPYLFPLLGLVLFWALPWKIALPVYLGVLAVSAIYWWATVRTFREPLKAGREAMIGVEGIVLRDGAVPLVRVHNELWNAIGDGPMVAGEAVRVVSLEGLRLRVEPIGGRR